MRLGSRAESRTKASPLSGIAHHLESLIGEYGVAALFVSVMLEALGAPLPGESRVILASTAAAARQARHLCRRRRRLPRRGRRRQHRLSHRPQARPPGRSPATAPASALTDAAFDRVEAIARKHGPLMVVVARFVVVLRQLNGIVAGTTGMPWPVFLLANAAGAALWVAVWTTLAYKLRPLHRHRPLHLAPPQRRDGRRGAAPDRGAGHPPLPPPRPRAELGPRHRRAAGGDARPAPAAAAGRRW